MNIRGMELTFDEMRIIAKEYEIIARMEYIRDMELNIPANKIRDIAELATRKFNNIEWGLEENIAIDEALIELGFGGAGYV